MLVPFAVSCVCAVVLRLWSPVYNPTLNLQGRGFTAFLLLFEIFCVILHLYLFDLSFFTYSLLVLNYRKNTFVSLYFSNEAAHEKRRNFGLFLKSRRFYELVKHPS